jgi:GcvH upstream region-like protein
LRKHQRYFFVVITAAIVVSFSFFGTYSAFSNQSQSQDIKLFNGVSGKPVMQQELSALCRLIENSPLSRFAWEKSGMPNFLNDGVIEKDFLASGLGMMLCKRYFADLKSDLDERVKKIHHFRPYVHPKTKQISSENAWVQFAPKLSEHYRAIKARSDQSTTETLALMCQLYLEQSMLPPDMLKQVLMMQQNQQEVAPDPLLSNADLSLFGFKTMEDWFGPRFVSLVAQFILNAAQLAEEKGYVVKTEEIRADLYQNIYHGYQQTYRNAQLKPEEVDQYFQMKMHHLGLDETMLLSTWKKVMLFRRLFEDGSGSVIIDALAYRQFEKFTKENVKVCLYQLPAALQLSDFRSMLKLQVYLEGVAADASRLRTDMRIPKQFASLDAIERKAPELIERKYEVEYSGISKEELARNISIKETLDWETEDNHWEVLKRNFTELAVLKAVSKEQRKAALDKLDSKLRVKVDQFARLKMVEEQPEKIKLALLQVPLKESSLSLRMRGGELPFSGIKDSSELIGLLEKASTKDEAPNAASQRLEFYSPDHENYFCIRVIKRDPVKKILTFGEASTDGTLDKMLDKRLEEAYPEIRKKDFQYFQLSNGQWKPFKSVKDQVGKYFYADLLKSIEDHYRIRFGVLPGKAGELPLAFYSNARLLNYMDEAKSALQVNPEDPSWLKTSTESAALSAQWLLEKKEQMIERCSELPFSKEEMFSLALHEWSSVAIGEKGALGFYFVQQRGINVNPPLNCMEQGHQILSYDAKRDMMLQILHKIQERGAIDLISAVKEDKR